MTLMTMSDAIITAIEQEMHADPSVYLLGQDVGPFGGPMQSAKGLWEQFGDSGRIIDAPISEAAMIGTAVGAAMTGSKPIVDLMFAEFLALTTTPLGLEGAGINAKSNGRVTTPMLVRAKCGVGPHRGHAESLVGMLMGFPGLSVIMPTTPQDAYSLTKSAMAHSGIVVMLEHMSLLHGRRSEVDENLHVTLGSASIVEEGNDVTIVASGLMVSRARRAAKTLAQEGIATELIDLRSLSPIDADTLTKSVQKTGALVIAEESWPQAGPASEVCAQVIRALGNTAHPRIEFVTPPHSPIPFSAALEKAFVPSVDDIVSAAHRVRTLAPHSN